MAPVNPHDRPTRAMRRYVAYQLPGLVLVVVVLALVRRWADLPLWAAGGILALWVAKDVFLFPLVWRAYVLQDPDRNHPLVGTRGTASERLDPGGYVEVAGGRWWAELPEGSPPVKPGEEVEVSRIRGITLLVRPVDGEAGTGTRRNRSDGEGSPS